MPAAAIDPKRDEVRSLIASAERTSISDQRPCSRIRLPQLRQKATVPVNASSTQSSASAGLGWSGSVASRMKSTVSPAASVSSATAAPSSTSSGTPARSRSTVPSSPRERNTTSPGRTSPSCSARP